MDDVTARAKETIALSLTVSVSCLYCKRWLHHTHQFCRQFDNNFDKLWGNIRHFVPGWANIARDVSLASPVAFTPMLLVSHEVTAQLPSPCVHALATRPLQLCSGKSSAIYYSATLAILDCTARLVIGLQPFDHVTTTLKQLHWLPIVHDIWYKLCLLIR